MIVLFDGVCNLCHSTVRFILRRDRRQLFSFASLQSKFARGILEDRGRAALLPAAVPADAAGDAPGSLILIDGQRVWVRSSAALRIARRLRWPWPLLAAFLIVPPFLRDLPYRLIARTRYRFFGMRSVCSLPSSAQRERFLDRDEMPAG